MTISKPASCASLLACVFFVLTGCKPKQNAQTTIQADEHAVASKIDGGFGKKLGDVFQPPTNENKKMWEFTPQKVFRSFKKYRVMVTPTTHRIYLISASAPFNHEPEASTKEQQVVIAMFQKQYGGTLQRKGGDEYELIDGVRSVETEIDMLDNLSVSFWDHDLAKQADAEEAQAAKAESSQTKSTSLFATKETDAAPTQTPVRSKQTLSPSENTPPLEQHTPKPRHDDLAGVAAVQTPASSSESAEEPPTNRDVDTLYSSDVADMNLNIDSPLMEGEIFPETRKRLLTANEIKDWPDEKLQYAINEMYARRNANFGNKKIKKFFLAFDWYTPIEEATFEAVEMHFSAVETSNLKLLAEAREKLKTRGSTLAGNNAPQPSPTLPAATKLASHSESARPTSQATRGGKTSEQMMKENDEWIRGGMAIASTSTTTQSAETARPTKMMDGVLKQVLAPRVEAMTPDSHTGGLNLETSLFGGPSSAELEQLLQTFVTYDPALYPAFLSNTREDRVKTNQIYDMKMMHNQVTSAKVTNEYTKIVDGETVFVYEFDGKAVVYLGDKPAGLYPKLDGYTMKIIKRGKKWYGERASE